MIHEVSIEVVESAASTLCEIGSGKGTVGAVLVLQVEEAPMQRTTDTVVCQQEDDVHPRRSPAQGTALRSGTVDCEPITQN